MAKLPELKSVGIGFHMGNTMNIQDERRPGWWPCGGCVKRWTANCPFRRVMDFPVGCDGGEFVNRFLEWQITTKLTACHHRKTWWGARGADPVARIVQLYRMLPKGSKVALDLRIFDAKTDRVEEGPPPWNGEALRIRLMVALPGVEGHAHTKVLMALQPTETGTLPEIDAYAFQGLFEEMVTGLFREGVLRMGGDDKGAKKESEQGTRS